MCWWTIKKKIFDEYPDSYHKVATQDIAVYKFGDIVEENFISSELKKKYASNIANKHIRINLIKDNQRYYEINEAYDSYSENCSLILDIPYIFVYPSTQTYDLNKIIGKFIIPKGTEYYENNKGEIVSTQLLWTGNYICNISLSLKRFLKLKYWKNVLANKTM